MKKIILLMLTIFLCFSMAACNDTSSDDDGKNNEEEVISPEESENKTYVVSFSKSIINLDLDELVDLPISYKGVDSIDEIEIISSDEDIAMVVDNKIIPMGVGTTTITATIKEKEDINATITINVEDYNNEYFYFRNDKKEVFEKTTFLLGLTLTAGYTMDDLDLEMSVNDIVEVNGDEVKALRVGEVDLIYSLKSNPLYKAKCTISIKYVLPKIETATNSILVNQTLKLNITNLDSVYASSMNDFSYSSNDQSIATINDKGVITGVKEGTVSITITNKNNADIKTIYELKVYNENTTELILNTENGEANFDAGKPFKILTLKDASLYDWSTTDTSIASVDSKGEVIGYSDGKVAITATLKSNSNVKATILVNIKGTYIVNYLERFINIALGEVGTVEGKTNITKYGAWYGLNGEPWCAMYVSWCSNQAGISKTIIPHYAAVRYFKSWYEDNNIFKYKEDYTPKCGDLIIFMNDGASHIGIVLGVKDGKVYTVEGNTSDMCARRNYSLSHHTITGYCVPNWPTGSYAPEIDLETGSTSGGGQPTT